MVRASTSTWCVFLTLYFVPNEKKRKSLSEKRSSEYEIFVVQKVVLSVQLVAEWIAPLQQSSCTKPLVIGKFFFRDELKMKELNLMIRFHAIMVDNGVLRLNEGQTVYERLNKELGVNLTLVDASDLFLQRLEGVEESHVLE